MSDDTLPLYDIHGPVEPYPHRVYTLRVREYHKIIEWCAENLNHRYTCRSKYPDRNDPAHYEMMHIYMFGCPNDAFAFKLRWA